MRKRHRDVRLKKEYTRRPEWKLGRNDACGILLLSNPEFIFMFTLPSSTTSKASPSAGLRSLVKQVLPLDEPGTPCHVRYREALSGRTVSLASTLLNGARGVCAVVGLSKARTTSSKPRPVFPSTSADV